MYGHWAPLGMSAFLCAFVSALATPSDNATLLLPRLEAHSNPGLTAKNWTMCDYTVTFDTLADLNLAIATSELSSPITGSVKTKGTMRSDCIAAYALGALINMLDTAYNNYTVINNGYDTEFGFYVTYMRKTVAFALDNSFMFNTSDPATADVIAPLGPGMKYFDCKIEGKDESFPCTQIPSHTQDMSTRTTKMTLKDKNGYIAAINKAGISPDWIHLGPHTVTHDLVQPRAGRKFIYDFAEYPIENTKMMVQNPKDVVTKALPSIPGLRTEMRATLLDIMLGQWVNGTASDAAYAYSTPVFMLMQAVDSMAQAKALGETEQKQEEEAEKNFIVMILSVVLMFVPIIGEEAATAAGLATLARAISIAGEVGNGALGIYDSVTNPRSAVINILGMLLGVGGIAKVARDAPGLTKIAKLQRTMDAASAAKFGKVFKSNFDELQPVMKFCKWS